MAKLPCLAAYTKALLAHSAHPLRSGTYKLREANVGLLKTRKTLEVIANSLRSSKKLPPNISLGCCMPCDCDIWMNDRPVNLARVLGRDIVPAIAALAKDGLPATEVDYIAVNVEPLAMQLVKHCDEVLYAIKPAIKTEYDFMCAGQSQLIDLVDDALDLVGEILNQVEMHERVLAHYGLSQ